MLDEMDHANESRASRYTTLAAGDDVLTELEVKRSRFVGYLRRVETESAAREFVGELRRRHHDARHHCSAFVLGADRDVRRSSDDGEPAGTAGVPMLEALVQYQTRAESADLSDVCAVVVRYFGGVKLGAGGLVRAYSDAVSSSLAVSRLVSRERSRLVELSVPLAQIGSVEAGLRDGGAHVLEVAYAATDAVVRLAAADRADAYAELESQVAAVTAGRGRCRFSGTHWADFPLD